MDTGQLEHIYKELQDLYLDVRAEVVVAEILENSNTSLSNYTVRSKSTFSRTYRRDILGYDFQEENDDISLRLSRSGIYDILPEGVFHNAADPKLKTLSHQKRRERQKREEREARLFFQPIENELFGQQVAIEKKERELYDHFGSIKDNFLLEFWQIKKNLPKDLVSKLIKLLPYVHSIIGDMDKTALCLEKILNEKVSITTGWENPSDTSNPQNGEVLGVDFVLASNFSKVLSPTIIFQIGPIAPSNAHQYVKGTCLSEFLDVFFNYFVPMEMDVQTIVEVEEENLTFRLDESEPPIMGFTTII